jgi:DNA gyrase subunit A
VRRFTRSIIYGYEGVREAFKTGRGRVVMRAKVGFEEVEVECIIVSEIPYQVNKADMIKRTADLVNDKKLKELQIFVMNQIEMVCVSFIF